MTSQEGAGAQESAAARSGGPAVPTVNVANLLTMSRLLLVPVRGLPQKAGVALLPLLQEQ